MVVRALSWLAMCCAVSILPLFFRWLVATDNAVLSVGRLNHEKPTVRNSLTVATCYQRYRQSMGRGQGEGKRKNSLALRPSIFAMVLVVWSGTDWGRGYDEGSTEFSEYGL